MGSRDWEPPEIREARNEQAMALIREATATFRTEHAEILRELVRRYDGAHGDGGGPLWLRELVGRARRALL